MVEDEPIFVHDALLKMMMLSILLRLLPCSFYYNPWYLKAALDAIATQCNESLCGVYHLWTKRSQHLYNSRQPGHTPSKIVKILIVATLQFRR